MLEERREKEITCQHCGTRPDEWIDERGRDIYPRPYKVDSLACRGCELLHEERSREEVQEAGPGIYLRLIRNEEG